MSDHISNRFEAEAIVSITTRLLQVMISNLHVLLLFKFEPNGIGSKIHASRG